MEQALPNQKFSNRNFWKFFTNGKRPESGSRIGNLSLMLLEQEHKPGTELEFEQGHESELKPGLEPRGSLTALWLACNSNLTCLWLAKFTAAYLWLHFICWLYRAILYIFTMDIFSTTGHGVF